jgi:putative endonuclease
MPRSALGQWGEETAARYLIGKGYQILDRNWHCAAGELDLVAQDGDTWVFVEVKARRQRAFGLPEESVTPAKRRKLQRAAWAYLETRQALDDAWRLDVIAIEQGKGGGISRLDHYPNAIDGLPLDDD